ncbi:hypothetical protein ACFSCX_05390 [Bacillus salitolerans]|uniref:Uncharacterized protein n=1 Tax=Bacillus salitolerans TaxID=1437434 RepID=A0ABW4LLC7_9BACI
MKKFLIGMLVIGALAVTAVTATPVAEEEATVKVLDPRLPVVRPT